MQSLMYTSSLQKWEDLHKDRGIVTARIQLEHASWAKECITEMVSEAVETRVWYKELEH